jgi:hypothetical protein
MLGQAPQTTSSDVLLQHADGRSLSAQQIRWFADQGVCRAAVEQTFPVLSHEVVFLPGKRFEFAPYLSEENGVTALTFVVVGRDGPVDIFAWQPRLRLESLWLGRAFALGEEQIHPRIGPLEIRKSVLSWLISGRSGIAILRPELAWLRLQDIKEVIAEDIAHGELLDKLLRPYRTTNIFVSRSRGTKHEPADLAVA